MGEKKDSNATKIPFEFGEDFASLWSDINATYHVLGKLEDRLHGLIKWARHTLSDQEFQILQLRFEPYTRIHDEEGEPCGRQSLEETAQRLGITRQRAQQIEKKALEHLGVKLYHAEVAYKQVKPAKGEGNGAGNRAALGSRKLKEPPDQEADES